MTGDAALGERGLALHSVVERMTATKSNRTEERNAEAAEHEGLAEAYLAYGTPIYSYVRRMISNEADAEDLTLAAFEKALRAWDRRPPDAELRPWLFRIATNTCLDELRRRRLIKWRPWDTFVSLFHPSQIAPDDPEDEALRNEQVTQVRAALARLAPRDRAALVMREYQGLSMEEIGRTLGISSGGAKVALFRARERLRTVYLQLGGEMPTGDRPTSDLVRDSHA